MATSFFNRWSQRKLHPQEEKNSDIHSENNPSFELESLQIESLQKSATNLAQEERKQGQTLETDDAERNLRAKETASDDEMSVADLLISQAEASVKKAALRKLFLSEEFNQLDGLNDYDHDYSKIQPLAADVASKLRDWINQPETEDKAEDREKEEIAATSEQTENETDTQDELDPKTLKGDEKKERSETETTMRQNIPHKE